MRGKKTKARNCGQSGGTGHIGIVVNGDDQLDKKIKKEQRESQIPGCLSAERVKVRGQADRSKGRIPSSAVGGVKGQRGWGWS